MITIKNFLPEVPMSGLPDKSEIRDAANTKACQANSKCKGAFRATANAKIIGMYEESGSPVSITC